MAIAVDEPTMVDTFLYYGLFVGAIFQLVCILSVVFVPKSAEEQELDENDRPVEPSASTNTARQVYDSSRKGKKHSKKHR